MKSISSLILFSALQFLGSFPAAAAQDGAESEPSASELREAEIQERVQRVAEQIKQRRQARQALGQNTDGADGTPREIAYSPATEVGPNELVAALIVDAPMESAAETYALLAQKKVRVSATVSKLQIVVRTEELPRTEACAAFEVALIKAGVAVQPLDENTVMLLAAKTADEEHR